MDEERVTFPSDALTLEGMLLDRGGTLAPVVAFAPHPLYGGNMDNPVIQEAARLFASKGHPVLLVNYRGVGKSEGGFGGGEGEIEDAQAAIEFVKKETGGPQVILCGYSFGAWVSIECASRRDDILSLYLVSPPNATLNCGSIKGCREAAVFAGDNDQFCDIAALKEAGFPEPVIIAGADHFYSRHLHELLAAIDSKL